MGIQESTCTSSAHTARIVERGNSVIIDSPCLYTELVEHGIRVATEAKVKYRYIECQLTDMDELDRRLRTRDTKPSQISFLDQMLSHAGARPTLARELIGDWASRVQRPKDNWLLLDTSEPFNDCVSKALAYIER